MADFIQMDSAADIPGNEPAVTWLLPSRRHPYYIVAPRYIGTSAGIKSLHLFCHSLNRAGERAYLITQPYYLPVYAVNPALQTPLVTTTILRHDFERGLAPIVVYPETIKGNPFRAPFVTRYIMNIPGLLGGDSIYDDDEYLLTYSKALAEELPRKSLTVFVPASDPTVFYPDETQQRMGTCFYAGKYKYFHQGELLPVTQDSLEITREQPNSQTPQQLADLFRRSELFYCYENSALAIEAVLCGCPVVFIPNRFFTKVIGQYEHGWDGMAWGTDADEIARAKRTVGHARMTYLSLYTKFREQLSRFVTETQQIASEVTYERPMEITYLARPNIFLLLAANLEIIRSIMSEKGWVNGMKIMVNRVRRKSVRILP